MFRTVGDQCSLWESVLPEEVRRLPEGTVTLIEMCSGAVSFRAVAMDQRRVVGISGGSVYSVERGNLTPGREAFSHLGSPSGRAEPVPSRPKVSEDAAKG